MATSRRPASRRRAWNGRPVSHGHLVDRLERAGYVHRVPDPTDARARLVQMAERGRQVLAVPPYR